MKTAKDGTVMNSFYLPAPDEDGVVDNPHVCILVEMPCLACELIAIFGEEHRTEAVALATRLAESVAL